MNHYSTLSIDQIRASMPAELPPGVAAIVRNYYDRPPISFNTDWAGTMPMWGLMMWAHRGLPGAREYVRAWFDAHLQRDPGLSDEQLYQTYNGHRSRVIRGRQLPFTTYCGLYGLNYPCSELYLQSGDERARQVCQDVADTIVYRARRNRFGLVGHDDHWAYDIPDAGFFVIEPLMRSAAIESENGWVYRKQAVIQLRAYIDVFLDRSNGLAKTILGPEGVGKTYWCRAQGWLMWCFTAGLRGMAADDPSRPGVLRDLAFFAHGLAQVVDRDGAIHAFANEPDSPQETSGTAMVALALHESMRRGWLDGQRYGELAQRMARFCFRHVTPDGGFEKVYYEWALPAELHVESSRTVQFGPHIGALLWLADELTTV